MKKVDWIAPSQYEAWDDFVAHHPLGRVYHLSVWKSVLESAFAHIRGGIVALTDETGTIQAGIPVFNVRSWLLKNRTVCVPFATISDPLISTREECDQLWGLIADTSQSYKSKRVEIRTYKVDPTCLPQALQTSTRHKHHRLPLDRNEDALFRSFHESCIRARIKKAIKTGIVVEERRDLESLHQFHAMLAATRRRLGLLPMPVAFFESIYQWLVPNHARLYLAMVAGTPVGGILIFKLRDHWIAEYSGHCDKAPPGTDQLVYWHAIQSAKEDGAEYFSFGRTSPGNAGLLEYKRRWATIEEDLIDFAWSPQEATVQVDMHEGAVARGAYAAAKLLRHTPISVQQYLGDFCYRHLG